MIKPLRERINFGKVPPLVEVPYLLEFQKKNLLRNFFRKMFHQMKGLMRGFKQL